MEGWILYIEMVIQKDVMTGHRKKSTEFVELLYGWVKLDYNTFDHTERLYLAYKEVD